MYVNQQVIKISLDCGHKRLQMTKNLMIQCRDQLSRYTFGFTVLIVYTLKVFFFQTCVQFAAFYGEWNFA